MAARIQQLDSDILRQKRIVDELKRELQAVVWARTMLRALERRRRDLSDQLDPTYDQAGLN